ncbi:hypothetical protein [Paracoccus sp. TOH]|uniref:hypothetical protein n=1 Tax=Paracoccus sp. TOH TaxID=1263728 RepID=UPI0025B021E2|nr:hypothetical protein [Paracoccus sp. TOH]WJS83801.1 hypothetical protein NBE95_08470 [Paracoccus sp. TOH]
MACKTVLADHADYRITLHVASAQPSQRIVITFGGQPSGLADDGFGTPFCLEHGWDTIYVAQRHGTQFQGLSIQDFQTVVRPVCAGRDVVTYGSSLGAYAALYYGGAVDARMIAAAPMLPAWRPLKLRAYEDLPVTHGDIKDGPLSRHDPVVIYDPHIRNDTHLIRELVAPAYPNLRPVEVPYAGHTVLVTLSQARLLKPLVLGIIEHDAIIPFDPPGEGTAIYHGELGRSLIRTDRKAARAELEKSLAIAPSKRFFGMLVNLLIRSGDHEAAQQLICKAENSGDKRLGLVPSVRQTAINAGLRVG